MTNSEQILLKRKAAWNGDYQKAMKLKEAKKVWANKRARLNRDEFSTLMDRAKSRKKSGIPLHLPKMKPWDFEKGRVSQATA